MDDRASGPARRRAARSLRVNAAPSAPHRRRRRTARSDRGPDAFFGVSVLLTNEHDDEIVIDALQGRLAIEGENVAQAALASSPVRIPAHGTARAEMVAHTGMDAVLRAVAAAMRRGATIVAPGARPTLRYSIEGSATLNGGYRLPFSRTGELGQVR